MTSTRAQRLRAFERGEGTLRFVFFLAVIAIAGYLAIQNVPTYFAVQNCKHDLAELARGTGVIRRPADRVAPQAAKIAQDYDIPPSDVKVENFGAGGIKITLDTTKKINFIVTDYDWHVSEVYSQAPY